MWLDNSGQEEEAAMHNKHAEFNVFPDNVYKNPSIEFKTNTNTIPSKYLSRKGDWYNMTEWRSMWRFEKAFEEHYPVSCQLGWDTDTDMMRQSGWDITLEFNRATNRRKLSFRHKKSGLMARVPFEFSDTFIDIPMFYAVKNYHMKAAKFTEIVTDITEDFIPDLLEWMREVKKNKISDYVCNKKQKEAEDKIIEFGNYLHNQQQEAA